MAKVVQVNKDRVYPKTGPSFSDGGDRNAGDGYWCNTKADLEEARASVAAGNAWQAKYLGGGTQGIGWKNDVDPKRPGYGRDISAAVYDDDYSPDANVGRSIIEGFDNRGKFSRPADRRRK
jgi:hypothetical protein